MRDRAHAAGGEPGRDHRCQHRSLGRGLDPALAAALARYPVSAARAQKGMLELFRNLHRLNIMATYRLYEAGVAGRTPG